MVPGSLVQRRIGVDKVSFRTFGGVVLEAS